MKIVFQNDPYEMNWLREDFRYGKAEGPAELDFRLENKKEGDIVFTRIEIFNPGSKPYFTDKGSISVAFPLVDMYEDSKTCMEQRCHTHIFCGGDISYVCAFRMGGEAPHLGMILTKGSLSGYSIQRDLSRQSNDRGCFLLHPAPMEIGAGERKILEWIVFPHSGGEDFVQKLEKYNPNYVSVSARHYVLFREEKNILSIRPSFAAKQVTVNGQLLKKTARTYEFEYTAKETGEHIFHIQADNVHTWCRTFVQEKPAELAAKRCAFVAEHQQYHGNIRQLAGAYLAYDNEEDKCIYRPENDYNGGRERIGMGILMARYLQDKKESSAFLMQSLEQYRKYVLRELVDAETGQVFNDIDRDNSFKRLYNAPWAAVFFTELYLLMGEKENLIYAYRILKEFYREGGRDFYPIELPICMLDEALDTEGMEKEKAELRALYREHADRICDMGIYYPASEVNYEQSIVAPAASILLSTYVLTKEEKYLRAGERQLAVLELFNGMQPDYHLYEAAIRHWDGYWFGKRRYYGDTFPHYWSALTGDAFGLYGKITGKEEYLKRAEDSKRAVLPMIFADGKASCAYVYPYTVNGRKGEFYDPYANDQDWGLYLYIRKMYVE